MEGARDRSPVQARLDEDDEDGRRVQAESQSDREPFDVPTIASIGSAPLATHRMYSYTLRSPSRRRCALWRRSRASSTRRSEK